MQVGLIPTLLKNIFKARTLTPGLVLFSVATFLVGTMGFMYQIVLPLSAGAANSNWDVSGAYVVSFDGYKHDMALAQDTNGNITGGGGYLAGEPYTYAWAITSGSVDEDTIHLTAEYTLGAIGTTMHMTGTILPNGTLSGTWDDNFGGSRTGSWSTISGNASMLMLPGSLSAEDFGVVQYDTGLGYLSGYSAGFGLTGATFEDAQSVVIKLYAGPTLLQTNTATAKVGNDIVGNQISTPFDISGTFDYAADGYWVNVRSSEYGQTATATKVVATVTLKSGKIVTAQHTNLTGDPTTIYPPAPTSDVRVTIFKMIDGAIATANSAHNTDFPMSATWDADNIGAGTGEYALSELGYGGDSTPYRAQTTLMATGADYSTKELTTGAHVGANCAVGKHFALVGYTTGNNYGEAFAATPTTTAPNFKNLTMNKTVLVWNSDCEHPTPTDMVYVTINKFIDGKMATSGSAHNYSFPMKATWETTNVGTGTALYSLENASASPYQAKTVAMKKGAQYSTKEMVNGAVVGAQCATGRPFALLGYTVGNTYAQAASGTPTMPMPNFTNLTSDKYVIVWNRDCLTWDGEVEEGDGVLAVTSIQGIDTSATANGSFADGWEYLFRITMPMSEPNLAMKFSNWTRNGGNGSIAVANNMRISSLQANNGGATVLLTAADTYSTPALHMTGDLNAIMAGRQVEVTVEVAIPAGTPSGNYTTNYGVRSTP